MTYDKVISHKEWETQHRQSLGDAEFESRMEVVKQKLLPVPDKQWREVMFFRPHIEHLAVSLGPAQYEKFKTLTYATLIKVITKMMKS